MIELDQSLNDIQYYLYYYCWLADQVIDEVADIEAICLVCMLDSQRGVSWLHHCPVNNWDTTVHRWAPAPPRPCILAVMYM